VTLADDGRATRLSYAVEAEVGGRLAQLGGPIIDATAKQLAGQFFRNFNAVVSGAGAPAEDGPVAAVTAPVLAAPSAGGHPWGWIIALLLALATGVLLERSGVAGTGMVAIGLLLAVTALAGFEAGRRGRR
jgi:MFS superfamily sulfate permease-like transporter